MIDFVFILPAFLCLIAFCCVFLFRFFLFFRPFRPSLHCYNVWGVKVTRNVKVFEGNVGEAFRSCDYNDLPVI